MSRAALVSLALAVLQPSVASALAERVMRPARVGVRGPGSQRADTYGAETQPLEQMADSSAPAGEALEAAATIAASERAPHPPASGVLPQPVSLPSRDRPHLWRPLPPSPPFIPWRPLPYTSGRPPPVQS